MRWGRDDAGGEDVSMRRLLLAVSTISAKTSTGRERLAPSSLSVDQWRRCRSNAAGSSIEVGKRCELRRSSELRARHTTCRYAVDIDCAQRSIVDPWRRFCLQDHLEPPRDGAMFASVAPRPQTCQPDGAEAPIPRRHPSTVCAPDLWCASRRRVARTGCVRLVETLRRSSGPVSDQRNRPRASHHTGRCPPAVACPRHNHPWCRSACSPSLSSSTSHCA
jgi:hypothetical protein